MAKKEKPGVNKVRKKVSDEFEKTSAQLETLVNDAFRQFDNLQNQIQEPVKKLVEELEVVREREMKRFSEELERRLSDFRDIQNNILERVGMANSKAGRKTSSTPDSAPKSAHDSKTGPANKSTAGKSGTAASKTATTSKSAKSSKQTAKNKSAPPQSSVSKKTGSGATAKKAKSAAKTTAKTAASTGSNAKTSGNAKKAGTPPKAAAKTTARTTTSKQPKAANNNDLTRIKGVGPATAEKMRAMGITSIQQIAAPSDADGEKLKEFSRMRGFDTWRVEAKKLLT